VDARRSGAEVVITAASRDTWPIVVGGCFRSGTSLVRRLLNAHSRIHCGPEVKFFRDLHGDYVDDPLKHLRFASTARSLAPDGDVLEVLGRAFIELHERAAARAGKPRWADKTPENVLYLADWERLLGDRWLYVHVVRNPLDTLASIKEHPFPLSIPGDLGARIGVYRTYTQTGLDFVRRRPQRARVVCYEALVAQPEATLRALMAWLGETLEAGQLAFNAHDHGDGLEDPKVALATGVHADSVGRWRTVLTAEEADAVWRALGETWAVLDEDGRYDPGESAPPSPPS
jgi:hypothetical protein